MKGDLSWAIPREGFIADYMAWASSVVMAPPEFHLACILAVLATVMGNEVTFPLGAVDYPPHLWLVLMARSGGRKSSAMKAAFSLLDAAAGPRYRQPTDMSREALWQMLSAKPTGYIALSEFLAFLQASRRDYMSGITADLCHFYDCPEVATRELVRGPIRVERPAITIVGAAVADAVGGWARSADLTGGFFSRFLFVVQESEPDYIGMVSWTGPERDRLKDALGAMAVPYGQTHAAARMVMPGSAKAVEAWEDFDRRSQERPEARVPELSGLFSRSGLHAMKAATCYALARVHDEDLGSDRTPTPNEEDMRHAIAFVSFCQDGMVRLIEETLVAEGRESRDMERIRRAIIRLAGRPPRSKLARADWGWVDYSEVLRRTHLTSNRMTSLVDTMSEANIIEFRIDPKSVRDRKQLRLKPPEEKQEEEG